jgi:hypothetical protein
MVIPQGYTLSITGSFAVSIHRYGFPSDSNAVGFVAGAVVAFMALATIDRNSLRGEIARHPRRFVALLNVVPVVVVLAVVAATAMVGSAEIGFPLAGLLGAGGYVVLVSIFMWLIGLSAASTNRA